MKLYDRIYDIAADNYGLITSAAAKVVGASDKELSRFASDGRLERVGHGLYRIKYHVPGPFDPYAEAVALAGPEAYLFGEAVIAMHRLAPTNPQRITVATTKRIRRKVPFWLRIVRGDGNDDITAYEGIPSQTVAAAISSCKGSIMDDRLIEATENARAQGLLTRDEEAKLLALLESNNEQTQQ